MDEARKWCDHVSSIDERLEKNRKNRLKRKHFPILCERADGPVAPLADTACAACGGTGDHEKIILCDACDDEYHIYCLQPPLESIPPGEWYCPACTKDREYLYEHEAWQKAGMLLCAICDEVEKQNSTANATPSVQDDPVKKRSNVSKWKNGCKCY